MWLASDESSFVTGHALAVDGGYVIFNANNQAYQTDGTGAGTNHAELYSTQKRYLEGTYARQLKAGVPDADNLMFEKVPGLIRGAAEFAKGV